ncbi:MAG: DUF6141 family protein [Bacteroidales bacterium]|jgi:hypothetical protein|nr:DUF6141 family protein [Bacteroidales bacterium]
MKTENKPQDSKFVEVQHQRQGWIYMFILFLLILNVVAIIQQVIFDKPFGNQPAPDWGLFVSLILPIGLFIFMYLNRLKTHITDAGIWVKYRPIHLKWRYYPWDSIEAAHVRFYRPLKEYGGYGYRIKIGTNSQAMNVSGKTGLQLVFKSGRHLLIGTKRGDDMDKVVERYREINQIDKFTKTA